MISDRALDTKTDEIVALKKMRMENEKDGKHLFFSFAQVFCDLGLHLMMHWSIGLIG